MVFARSTIALAAVSLLASPGCNRISARRSVAEPQAGSIEIAVPPVKPTASTEPGQWAPMPAQPVFRNPKIGVVYLRAYQDAQGRLFGPQVMYQVTDPGGWNVEAAQAGGGYIPAADHQVPPTPAAAPAPRSPEALPPRPGSPLMTPDLASRIAFTGLMERGDRSEAEALAAKAGGGCSAVFDEQAGWILVPPAAQPAPQPK